MATILVVDDSEALRTQLRKDLEASGHSVVDAENGAKGIAAVEQNSDIALIICDVNMPVMDGLTMCLQLSKNETHLKIPKLMLTTEASSEMKARAKEAGVNAWIVKPYRLDKLLLAISKLVQPK